jgi:hypothetical protein
VDAAILQADPAAAQGTVEADRADHGVWVSPTTERGSKTVFIRADAPDVIWFDATVDRIADGIGLLGDPTSKTTRRARAVGVIANPQQTLNLFDRAAAAFRTLDPPDRPSGLTHDQDPDGDTADNVTAVEHQSAASRATGVDPRPPATLYVHIAAESVPGQDSGAGGVARVEGVGPVTVEQARRWLGHCVVTVKPVIDLAGVAPVDSYEIPDRVRDAVRLVSPADVFPYASNTGRRLDLDHTQPYQPTVNTADGSPSGQTRVGNLAPMTRFHHRVKTHGRWQVTQPFPGIFIWRTPHGRHYLVDHTGTRRLPRAG